MDGRTWIALLALPLGCGALFMSQAGCNSQRAITIVVADASAPDTVGTPESPDSLDVLPDAQALVDVVDVVSYSDTMGRFDTLDAFDGLARADTIEALPETLPEVVPEVSSPETAETAARDTAPEVATAHDTLPAGPVVLFSDGFDDGFEYNWQLSESSDGPVTNSRDGTNAIATLDSSQNDFTRIRSNLAGERFKTKDITASMSLRVDQAPSSTRSIRLDVRQAATTANIFYAVGVVVATDGAITKVSIFKKVPDGNGDYTICELASASTTRIAMNQWRRLKLTISGSTSVSLAAFFEDQQVATFKDDCTSTLTATNGDQVPNPGCLEDQTGLGIQVEKGLKASVDDVLVTTP